MTIDFWGLSQNAFSCQSCQLMFYNINICTADNYAVNSNFVMVLKTDILTMINKFLTEIV